MKKGIRNLEKDKEYLHIAHNFLATHDPLIFMKKVKSVMFPFESIIDKGEKLDKFTYNIKDQ